MKTASLKTKNITNEELTKEEASSWAKGLDNIAERIHHNFVSNPTFERATLYIKGLLSDVERKNGWQLAESIGDNTPYGVQNFLNRASWNADTVRDDLQSYVTEHIGSEDGIIILDETGFLKKGDESVGVQYQYTGTAGGEANCQVGVFLAYTSLKGHTLIDRELYLPKSWTDDRKRCNKAGVPKDITFQTKPQLAIKMLERAFNNGIPSKWVTGDEVYGNNTSLRNWLEERKQAYVMTVSCSTLVDTRFEYIKVDKLAKTLPVKAWKKLSAGEGSKGHRWYNWAKVKIANMGVSEGSMYVLFRRSIEKPSEIAYYLVYSPEKTNIEEMVHVAGSRWTIENCFETAKNEVGLDQYEVRTWNGWYRHITLSLLAHAFLRVLCNQVNKQEAKKGGTITKISNMIAFKERRRALSH
jgi:SRSO17 transposase